MITNYDLGGHFPERDLSPPDFVDEHEIQRRKEAMAEEEWRDSTGCNFPIDPNVSDWLREHASHYIESCFSALFQDGVPNAGDTLRTMKRDYISFRVEWIEDGEVYL